MELRHRLGETQQSMAGRLGCALQTIARWETLGEPQSVMLWRLWELARDHHYDDLRDVFQTALDKFKLADRRKAEAAQNDAERWAEIQAKLIELMEEGMKLSKEKHPAGRRITEIAARLGGLTTSAREWSWRNK
jgi:hypothetical protein